MINAAILNNGLIIYTKDPLVFPYLNAMSLPVTALITNPHIPYSKVEEFRVKKDAIIGYFMTTHYSENFD